MSILDYFRTVNTISRVSSIDLFAHYVFFVGCQEVVHSYVPEVFPKKQG